MLLLSEARPLGTLRTLQTLDASALSLHLCQARQVPVLCRVEQAPLHTGRHSRGGSQAHVWSPFLPEAAHEQDEPLPVS